VEEVDGKEKDMTIDKQSIQSFARDATQMQDDSRLKPDITGDSQVLICYIIDYADTLYLIL